MIYWAQTMTIPWIHYSLAAWYELPLPFRHSSSLHTIATHLQAAWSRYGLLPTFWAKKQAKDCNLLVFNVWFYCLYLLVAVRAPQARCAVSNTRIYSDHDATKNYFTWQDGCSIMYPVLSIDDERFVEKLLQVMKLARIRISDGFSSSLLIPPSPFPPPHTLSPLLLWLITLNPTSCQAE